MTKTFNIDLSHNFIKGKDYAIRFTTEQDFTGYSLAWYLWKRPRRSGDSPVIEKTTEGGGIVINSSSLVTVTVEDVDTDGSDILGSDRANYWHELIRTDEGSEQVLSSGWVILRQSLAT